MVFYHRGRREKLLKCTWWGGRCLRSHGQSLWQLWTWSLFTMDLYLPVSTLTLYRPRASMTMRKPSLSNLIPKGRPHVCSFWGPPTKKHRSCNATKCRKLSSLTIVVSHTTWRLAKPCYSLNLPLVNTYNSTICCSSIEATYWWNQVMAVGRFLIPHKFAKRQKSRLQMVKNILVAYHLCVPGIQGRELDLETISPLSEGVCFLPRLQPGLVAMGSWNNMCIWIDAYSWLTVDEICTLKSNHVPRKLIILFHILSKLSVAVNYCPNLP